MKVLLKKIIYNKTLVLLALSLALLQSIFIDVRSYPTSPNDLRNRIVGSRILHDGGSPYYYVWKQGDPVKYYDATLPLNNPVSFITSTPFFHWIAEPVSSLPQYQLTVFWFILTYASLTACCLLVVLSLPTQERKKAALLALVAIALTYTTGWRDYINVGQNYIFPTVAALACYYCLSQKKSLLHLLLFGVFAVAMVLLRPITILLFTPFLLYFKSYYKWAISGAAILAAYTLFVMCMPLQKKNWMDYFSSIQVHTRMHQGLLPTPAVKPYLPEKPIIPVVEGAYLNPLPSDAWSDKLFKGFENSNLFYFTEELTGKKISVTAQTAIGLGRFAYITSLVLGKKTRAGSTC